MTGFLPSFTARQGAPKPLVIFATPSYSGGSCHEFLPSFTETLSALAAAGIASATMTAAFDPYLSKARNRLATDFLVNWPMGTHLFFLDDDVGWPGAKVAEFLLRDIDVIAGVYPKKSDAPEFPVALEVDDQGMPIVKNGLYRAKLAPTGFMCIKRHVLEKMAAISGQYHDTTKQPPGQPHWNIFDMGFFTPDGERPKNQGGAKGEFWGEDYYFCRRWRDIGGEVWIDPDIEFSHRGSKAWRANFSAPLLAWEAGQRAAAEAVKPVLVVGEPVEDAAA